MRDSFIKILSSITGIKDIQLEIPERSEFGDFSTNITLKGRNPREEAEKLVEKLKANKDIQELIEKIEVAGPGFINFWIKRNVLVQELQTIYKEADRYGYTPAFKGQKLMFEYAHPNTHKAFHIGHLRNITTGETLARLYEFLGADVIRANYQGDVGLHISKAIWGINKIGFKDPGGVRLRAEFLGKAYATGASAYEDSQEAKNEINEINGKIYDKSDKTINEIYEETRKWSLEYFETIYKRVYTKFDRLYFESEVAHEGKEIALSALKKGILEESEGAVIFPGSKYGLHDRVFISGKGTPTYEAKDLGLGKLQFSEYDPDKIIHTVGPEQVGYFQVIFKALELIQPETKGREVHIPYGWVRLKKGKMSSRTGNVVLGEAVLDEAKESIKKNYKTEDKVAEMIAVGAVKYSFLKTGLAQEIAFDLKESISLEGNSGPYLQYTVARTNSVLAKTVGHVGDFGIQELNSEEMEILRSLVRFPDIIFDAAKNYSPNTLCNYLYDLAQKFNTFYNKYSILTNDDQKVTDFRITLTSAVGKVLKRGLNLLGIESPEKM